jgi:hypothetical protein
MKISRRLFSPSVRTPARQVEERRLSPAQHRGRAALQRRVDPLKSGRASTPAPAFQPAILSHYQRLQPPCRIFHP